MPGKKRPGGRGHSLIRALPPDDLDAYEALKLQGFAYNFDNGWWYAPHSAGRVAFLLSAGYRRVD